jgi:menaquinone-dependent protoporphyrinogen oxidase
MTKVPMTRVLVTYASRYGSTQETAERVATLLEREGATVDRLPARELRTVEGYDAFVLGAGIYAGRLHKDARHALPLLRDVPLFVFAMGPAKADDFDAARVQLERALEHANVAPLSAQVFGGVFDPAKARFPLNRMPAVDIRDWEDVEAWARQVAALALAREPVPA